MVSLAEAPKGIDISNHQGIVDFRKVKDAGYSFVFMKATEGVSYKDPYFIRNWNETKRIGMIPGTYHFARPSLNAANDEADFFMSTVLDSVELEEGDILIQDMEDSNARGDLSGWAEFFVEVVRNYAGFDPLFYSRKNYIEEHNLGTPRLGQCGLWLAQYPYTIPTNWPPVPSPWSVPAFWQYSEKGTVPGVNGNCDLNYFNGTLDRLPLYGKPKTEKEPPPPVKPEIDLEAVKAQLNILGTSVTDIEEIFTQTQKLREIINNMDDAFVEIKRLMGIPMP